MTKRLIPGDRVEIRNIINHDDDVQSVYVSQISEIYDESRLEIYMPTEKSRMVLLPVGREYEIVFISETGMFQSRMIVEERLKVEQLFVLIIRLIKPLEKYQRRAHYRYECHLEAATRVLTKQELRVFEQKEKITIDESTLIKGIMLDISGGGARAVFPIELEGSVLVYRFRLKINGFFVEKQLYARLISVRVLDTKPKLYEHRIQFVQVSQKEREEIIQYIFDEERKNRKKKSEG